MRRIFGFQAVNHEKLNPHGLTINTKTGSNVI